MKRRSMLGRRSRAVQQSPLSAAFPSQSSGLERNPETPRLPILDKTSPHPFRTPSVDGSLTDLSSRVTDTWSVFKNSNVRCMQSPENDGRRRMNIETRAGHTSRLNRLKKNDPLCELRNIGFPNILSKKNGVNNAFGSGFYKDKMHSSTVVSSLRSHDLISSKYKGSVEQKENAGEQLVKKSEEERVARELLNLQKQWKDQDLRAVSPPWSHLSDFYSSSHRPTPTAIVSSPPKSPPKPVDFSSTLGVAPLESTVVDGKNEMAEGKQDKSFTELESLVNEETCVNSPPLDFRTALGNVSLGVNTIELLDKRNMNKLGKTSWGTKYKSPLLAVTEEEPELSLVGKENVPPGAGTDNSCSPVTKNETVEVTSEASSPKTPPARLFKEFQTELADLTSKIEAAEEKRLQAEKERRFFEGERKRVFAELIDFMEKSGPDTSQLGGKRPKLATTSAKKGRPSFVASKILKKDFKSPRSIGSFLRTPSQTSSSSTSIFVPPVNTFTPRSLRKNLNQQFNSIFGS